MTAMRVCRLVHWQHYDTDHIACIHDTVCPGGKTSFWLMSMRWNVNLSLLTRTERGKFEEGITKLSQEQKRRVLSCWICPIFTYFIHSLKISPLIYSAGTELTLTFIWLQINIPPIVHSSQQINLVGWFYPRRATLVDQM